MTVDRLLRLNAMSNENPKSSAQSTLNRPVTPNPRQPSHDANYLGGNVAKSRERARNVGPSGTLADNAGHSEIASDLA